MSAVPSGMPVVPTTSPPFFLISFDIGVARRLAPGIVGKDDMPLLAHFRQRRREGDRLRRRVIVQAEGVAVARRGGERGVEAHRDHVDDLGVLPDRHAGKADIRQEAADMNVDLVVLHHLDGLLPGDGGRALVVDDIEFDRAAVDAAIGIDAVGRHLQTDDRGLAAGGARRRTAAARSRSYKTWPRRKPSPTAPAPASWRRSRRRRSRSGSGA